MQDFCWIDNTARPLIVQHRLDDIEAVLARWEGQRRAGTRRGRDLLRIDVCDDAGQPRRLLLKRERTVRIKDWLGQWVSSGGYRTAARWELEMSWCLASAGILCPKPLACLESGIWPALGCLILEEASQTVPLGLFLSQHMSSELAAREAFFTQLGREVARLHAAGFHHPDLYSDHVMVAAQDDGWRIGFRDFENCARRHRVAFAQRAADLAALIATLSKRLASPRDHELLLDGYLTQSDLVERGPELQGVVERLVEQLLRQRRVWEIRESDTPTHRAVQPLEAIDTGAMWIDRDYRPALDEMGLTQFDAMMSTKQGKLLRALADRENWRLDLHTAHGPRGAYLKKHHVRTWRSRWRALIGAGPGKSPGRAEARNAARLARSGIAAMRLIAFGEKLHDDGFLESFVLTEELTGYTQLDHFLRKRFPEQNRPGQHQRDIDLDLLVRDVAAVASRFHKLGYNHRDLYCCHFFIREGAPGTFQVNLIDLQRVEHRRRMRSRWLVKDLAQLSYSAPQERITRTMKMAFIKRYLGRARLTRADKRFIRRILSKQRWMEWQLGKHP